MVRWVLIWGMVLIVLVRYLDYQARLPKFRPGEMVKIEMGVENPTSISLGKLLIKPPDNMPVNYGDRIRVIGKVKEGLITQPGKIYYLTIDKFVVVSPRGGIRKGIEKIRQSMIDKWKEWLPADEGALAAGILLGGTSGFTSEANLRFRRVGISHIIAASGYNVMVVAGWVTLLGLRLFGRRLAIPFVIISIILYMLLAGMGPPVIRAGIMAILTIIGLIVGRKGDAKWLLIITSLGMLIYKPEWVTSVSFQLSVGAMAAVIFVGGIIKNVKWPLSDLLSTLGVYVFTLPIILFWFGSISIVAPIANVAVLWVVPIIMEIAAAATALGWVSPLLGQLIAWSAWPELRWITWVTEKLAGWSGASWNVGTINLVWVFAYYIVLYLLIYFLRKKKAVEI